MTQGKNEFKKHVTRMMRWRPARYLLRWAVVLFAPRHRVGVNIVCLDPQGRILLLNHVYHPQLPWGLPGGWLAAGESPQDGVKRELREETGLEVEVENTLLIERSHLANHIEIIFLAFVGEAEAKRARPISREINDLRWFEPQELPARLSRTTRLALKRATEMTGKAQPFPPLAKPHFSQL